jgi:tripartite-type tricarboxylate transporter receptor subunit TctC
MLRAFAALIPVVLAFAGTSDARADFPERPITLVVPYEPGGVVDLLARLISQRLSASIGQPVSLDYISGSGSTLGLREVARAVPDGYTILLATSTITILPSVAGGLQVDIKRDLTPLTEAVRGVLVIAATPDMPFTTVDGMVAYAKQNPGRLRYGSGGVGTPASLAFELLKSRTGAPIEHVAFDGGAPATTAALKREVPLVVDTLVTLKPHLDRGRLRAIAITGLGRSPLLPQVPTVAESGLPGYEVSYWIGLFAPGGLPADIARKLSESIRTVVRDPKMGEEFNVLSVEPVGSTAQEFAETIARDTEHWSRLIEDAHIKLK